MKNFPLSVLLGVALVFSAGPLSAKPRHRSEKAAVTAPTRPLSGDDEKKTRFEFRHVNFHIDDTVVLQIDLLRGELLPSKEGVTPSFDEPDSMILKIEGGDADMTTTAFATLMNRYVLNYRNTPLTDVQVHPEGDHLHLTATLNRVIKTDMVGTLDATSDGHIRFHPTSIKTADIPTKALMDAVGLKADKLIKGTGARGVDVVGDDMIMDLDKLLPPPRVQARVTGVRVEGGRVAMTFGPKTPADTPHELIPLLAASNYMYLRGGTVRFAKLTMVSTNMEFVDAHAEDALDYSLTHYYEQLMAGYSKSTPDGGLVAYIPDYRQLSDHAATPDLRPPTPSGSTEQTPPSAESKAK